MWILMIITLQLTNPVHIVYADMVESFSSEKNCIERTNNIMDKAYESGKPVPPQINLCCVPLNLGNPYV
tara:strand:- start:164 stop:370 length:207 start_codon:yes stop_codon:yes gene_type:complete